MYPSNVKLFFVALIVGTILGLVFPNDIRYGILLIPIHIICCIILLFGKVLNPGKYAIMLASMTVVIVQSIITVIKHGGL